MSILCHHFLEQEYRITHSLYHFAKFRQLMFDDDDDDAQICKARPKQSSEALSVNQTGGS